MTRATRPSPCCRCGTPGCASTTCATPTTPARWRTSTPVASAATRSARPWAWARLLALQSLNGLDQAWAHVRYRQDTGQIWLTTATGGFWVLELEPQVRAALGLPSRPVAAPQRRHPTAGGHAGPDRDDHGHRGEHLLRAQHRPRPVAQSALRRDDAGPQLVLDHLAGGVDREGVDDLDRPAAPCSWPSPRGTTPGSPRRAPGRPGRVTTKAIPTSPRRSSGMPITAACWTSGWRSRAFSISAG